MGPGRRPVPAADTQGPPPAYWRAKTDFLSGGRRRPKDGQTTAATRAHTAAATSAKDSLGLRTKGKKKTIIAAWLRLRRYPSPTRITGRHTFLIFFFLFFLLSDARIPRTLAVPPSGVGLKVRVIQIWHPVRITEHAGRNTQSSKDPRKGSNHYGILPVLLAYQLSPRMGKPASQFRNGPPETGLESFKLTAILTAFAEKEKEESAT